LGGVAAAIVFSTIAENKSENTFLLLNLLYVGKIR
jgi:hypothetical protein